ncbi:MAG: enoyl-CoA hydratase/isomerase family protein [Candidatus Tectomicrobia bacterium]|uniref:Enoyl-CoA hydratase/isomerase family protein n=1 Tax=Tectimicrobiota bacterium TaxID=2528274 RepID=A0A933LQG8_UNCTE|nr:enoyl-CoA hydratase/isomerase family protein [Candidatus Tectomicrobia bacterium]
MLEKVLIKKSEGVGELILNRPEARNALNKELIRDILEGLDELRIDKEVQVILVSGAGDKAFCAGADLKELLAHKNVNDYRKHFEGVARIIEKLAKIPQPTIASVHGFALAGGCGLAAACEFTVASEDAKFGLPEITMALLPLTVMAPILRAVGRKKGLELVMTGEIINAQEAERIGLVTRIYPKEQLAGKTRELARKLASFSPFALQTVKEGFYTLADMEYFKSLNYLRDVITITSMSQDAHEGITAFLEKRTPKWTGS